MYRIAAAVCMTASDGRHRLCGVCPDPHEAFPSDVVPYTNLKLAFGFCAVVGHIFPVFAGFRGGKGIATLLGIVLAVHPQAALCSLAIFILILTVTKYVSLGSMVAGIAFPLFIALVFKTEVLSLIMFSSIVALCAP